MKQKPIENASEAREMAIDWQHWASGQNLSYDELHEWQVYFVTLGERFGLTEEFQENGIL